MGKVLAEAVQVLLSLKSKGRVTAGIEVSKDQLHDQLDIDVESMMSLNKHDSQHYLKKRNLKAGHIETLSTYFSELGKTGMDNHNQEKSLRLHKAMELLDISDEISGAMSFEREEKRREIEKLISSLE
jgi:hypothetical protein